MMTSLNGSGSMIWSFAAMVKVTFSVLIVALGRDGRRVDESVAHLLERQPGRGELRRIDLDADCRMLLAADDDLGHPVHLGDLLSDEIVRVVVHGDERQGVGLRREDEDRRVRGIDLLVARRRRHLLGQRLAGDGDRRLDVLARGVDVAAELELDGDRGRVERAHRGELGDAGNLSELPLERCGDRGRHRLGAGALKRRVHRYGREVDLRQRGHRQERHRDQSDEADRRHQQRSGYWPVDERLRDIHDDHPPVPIAAADIGNFLLLSVRSTPCVRSPAVPRFLAISRAVTTRFTFGLCTRIRPKAAIML